ncbi:hypothetical protein AQJ66_27985 [Streptomyces bungoensis]|uniref:Uncharacterized protein n=1 Tax=Streptomyces bungoensis TaxID=285568 RepID=A0A101ST96_9ACTN|nr:hypothetical protein AQJ66_27985 [Streptomyces bungoensis]
MGWLQGQTEAPAIFKLTRRPNFSAQGLGLSVCVPVSITAGVWVGRMPETRDALRHVPLAGSGLPAEQHQCAKDLALVVL